MVEEEKEKCSLERLRTTLLNAMNFAAIAIVQKHEATEHKPLLGEKIDLSARFEEFRDIAVDKAIEILDACLKRAEERQK